VVDGGSSFTKKSCDAFGVLRQLYIKEKHSVLILNRRKSERKSFIRSPYMQRMGVDTLTRENIASHLQKYRLALKRTVKLPENTRMTDSVWGLLEQAHDALVNHLPPPVAPAAPLTSAINISSYAAPSACVSSPSGDESNASKASAASKPALFNTFLPPLPPLMPTTSAMPTIVDLVNGSAAINGGGTASLPTLPTRYSEPLPYSDDGALGIPMSLLFIPKEPSKSTFKLNSRPPIALRVQGALPDLSSGSRVPKLEALTQNNTTEDLHAGVTGDTAVGSDAAVRDPMCTVYMLDPSKSHEEVGDLSPLCSHQGHSFMKATQVPQRLLNISAAAYGAPSVAADGTSAPLFRVASEIPKFEPTLSAGSVSKPHGFDDDEGSPAKRRVTGSFAIEDLSGETALSPHGARAELQPVSIEKGSLVLGGSETAATGVYAGSGSASLRLLHPNQTHMSRAMAWEPDLRGSCSALDALAKVAGYFQNGEEM
jgi:hypothetical protein